MRFLGARSLKNQAALMRHKARDTGVATHAIAKRLG
jgi:hypothetical protein